MRFFKYIFSRNKVNNSLASINYNNVKLQNKDIYKPICQKLGLSNTLKALVYKEIDIPYLEQFRSVFQYWHPHPLCLIPLFLDNGESYTGILHHFFCDRKQTFVEWSFETDWFNEIARNENQLYTLMVLDLIMVEDELTNVIVDFCKKIDYDKYNEVDRYANEYGDDLEKGSNLVYYNEHTPFIYINDSNDYDGDFPSSLAIINPKQIFNACSFELDERHLIDLGIDEYPLWLIKKENKKNLFDYYIANNQLKEAWVTLNSTGWYFQDVPEALEILKTKTNDELFHLIADNWIYNWFNFDDRDKMILRM